MVLLPQSKLKKKRFLTFIALISICLLAAVTNLHAQGFIEVPVKLDIEKGHLDNGVVVKVQKDGKDAFTQSGSSKMRFKFNYNMTYTLIFTKEGYITKTIEFDTHVPSVRIKAGFDPYTIGVKLYPQENEDHKVVYNQAVGRIRYDKDLDEFNYDTDYSKSILSNMEDQKSAENISKDSTVNKEIASEQNKEPEKLSAKEEKRNKKKLAEEKAEAEKLAIKERKEVLKQKADKKAVATAGEEPMALKESTEKLRGGKDENSKDMIAMSGGGDEESGISNNNGSGNDINKPMLPNDGNDVNKILLPNKGNDVNKVSLPNTGNDVNKMRLANQGNDINKKELKDKGADIPKKVWPATAGAEQNEKKLYASNGSESTGNQQYDESENITREDIVEDRRVITIIKVTKRNVTTEYRRVTYRWGGLYYFQDNKLSISENVFAFYTGVKE